MFRPVVQNKQGITNSDEDVHQGCGSVCATGKCGRFRPVRRGFNEIWYYSPNLWFRYKFYACLFPVEMHDANNLHFQLSESFLPVRANLLFVALAIISR